MFYTNYYQRKQVVNQINHNFRIFDIGYLEYDII